MKESHYFEPRKENSIRNYILELDAFYDRMLLIMKGMTPSVKEDNKDVTRWLKANNSEQYNLFKDSTTKSHNTIRMIANGIKHDTLAVDYLIVNNHKNIEIEGFYFSNIVGDDELIGPEPEIHKLYKDSATAFSYDYFIRYTAGFVASCIFHLNNILFKGCKPESSRFDVLYSYFKKNQVLGKKLFPDEYFSSVASLKDDKHSIVIKYPIKEQRDGNTDAIVSVRPLFKINLRTNTSNNQWPYLKLLN